MWWSSLLLLQPEMLLKIDSLTDFLETPLIFLKLLLTPTLTM